MVMGLVMVTVHGGYLFFLFSLIMVGAEMDLVAMAVMLRHMLPRVMFSLVLIRLL